MSDGYALRGRMWLPRTPATRCAVLYVHGIQSHGGWFEWSASLLARHGAGVLLPDRRGSGLNPADRGDTPAAERWLADLDELSDWAAREWGSTRCAVVGVSWGGKPALAWALRRPERVGRVLLIAPGLFPVVDIGFAARLRIGAALLIHPQLEFPIPLDDPALFTDNPAGRAFIADDPLKLTRATAKFFYESVRLDRMLRRVKTGALRAEATLILAGRDRIVRNEPMVAWLRRCAAAPPTVRTLADAAHTLEFEPEVGVLGELLTEWAQSLGD